MPVSKYEAFLKAAELGSLTRAAAELGVTQSAVSHMIGSLEEELGFSLLKRGRTGARPTAEGERVLPAIRGMLNSKEQLEQTAAAIRGPGLRHGEDRHLHQRGGALAAGDDKALSGEPTPTWSSS